MNIFPINQYLKNKDMETNYIDFIWSSQKEYFSLKPLYDESKKLSLKTRLLKIHKNKIRNYLKISPKMLLFLMMNP